MILAGDIGGTNTRLAILKRGEGSPTPIMFKKYPSTSWNSFPLLVKNFLTSHLAISEIKNIEFASFALAGPVYLPTVKLTNLGVTLELEKIRHELDFIPKIYFFNDLEALGFGILNADTKDFYCLYPGESDNGISSGKNKGIIAPGTGLGEALIINNQFVCTGEGGHSSFAPQSTEEIKLWSFLKKKYDHISWERVISGPGLVNIYEYLSKNYPPCQPKPTPPTPETITKRALARTCPISVQSLDIFIRILGGEAGNLALKILAFGGIYLGGGIPPKIIPKLKRRAFLEAFQQKGRFTRLMREIPIYVVINEDLTLIGAALGGKQKQSSSEQ